jgi:hypothetical protein
VEKTMMAMMGGINMGVYLLLSLRMSVLIVINGELNIPVKMMWTDD